MLPERKLNRLPNFDYSTAALYFITVCVQDGEHYFGKVADETIHLNTFGKIANEQFLWLKSQYPYLVLHTYVVMPNHVHAILEINPFIQKDFGQECVRIGKFNQESETGEFDQECVRKGSDNVRTGRDLSLRKIKSVSELVGAYKTTTSKKIRQAGLSEFAWQRSFHDHIIRDERGYQNIYHYIQNNPAKWHQDKFFKP
ncbi:transposase [Adhaeribacter soli]|uniref:Transposase IS200-like domain-containing protein n=1 Tax=Adhaeribacter soli TaxID=2607655 RepID=A0A5N1IP64_9BACT|nr:transposase [Adhaeribacter soli]KAA9331804.1 hypothetical protein F0P94_13450 [Adhaeribacter soli]